jgi:ESS family glutamate:Na+ symporter
VLELKALDTLAFGGLALLFGYGIRRMLPVLGRYNIPPPVIGGLLVAVVALVARGQGVTLFKFDTSLQSPMMIAFFTTVGFGASLSLLRTGGIQVAMFLGLASVFAILQNVIGALLASAFGLHPLFGVLSGSVTLAGGPATGLAFAPLFEQAGVPGAASVAVAAAMAGIVAGALFGGPVGTFLIERHRLRSQTAADPASSAQVSDDPEREILERWTEPEEVDAYAVLRNLVFLLVAMWAGSWVSAGFTAMGITLPAYIGAMIVAAVIRNVDDLTGWFGLSHRLMDTLGAVALSLFLALALMTLNLWELSGLALPLVVNVVAQLIMVMAVCAWPVFQVMGRDYDSAVMSGGFIGFMMGTTANAMAVMRTLVERYGAAPRAFLVAPLVGAFFIDFTNALIITGFLNFLS